jgi:5-deoxy-5-amino-3-dehydroquinate synthase
VITVEVAAGSRSYPTLVGPGARHELAALLPAQARRAAVVTQANIGVEVDTGREQRVFHVPDGEAAKTMAQVESLCSEFSRWGLTRADVVVGVGGGVVTDLAGFTAAVYHRGIEVAHVPTTLLGQVDAAIGGKTAVNLPEGKNLVGAFWQPCAVLCDIETLATLPEDEFRSGCGEVAKYHFLGGGDLDALPLAERVARCVAIKAAIVAADEREDGQRAVLNYGHTLAHVLEIAGGFDIRHGEAVAIGLIYAAELACHLDRIDAARVAEHRRAVAAYALPTVAPPIEHEQLLALMGRDKKAVAGLTFALERELDDGSHRVEVVTDVAADDIIAAFDKTTGDSS